jgi:hypothetical protein
VTTIESISAELATAVESCLPRWVVRSVEDLCIAYHGHCSEQIRADAEAAGRQAADDVMPAMHALLAADIDEQRTNPLAIVRRAVVHPTAVLRAAGVPPVVRDEFAEGNFPDDVYDLSPASFADIDPELHEPGLRWGAAKAHTHLRRRRQNASEETP